MSAYKLQEVLNSIHALKPHAPTQDALSLAAAEYALAQTIHKVAESRFKLAKEELLEFPEVAVKVIKGRTDAKEFNMAMSEILTPPDYHINLQFRAPPNSIDHGAFVSELIKLGVTTETITTAGLRSIKQGTPALVITVTEGN
jgi:hypothetical protein